MPASVVLGMLAGCALPQHHGRSYVGAEVERRTGFQVGPGSARQSSIPEGVSIEDGLSQDDAVSIALWNNPEFQEVLAELGFSRADLIQAGLLSNPVLSVLFPLGPKQLEFAAKLPLEALWLRPRRLAVARAGADRVAEGLVQSGLDLIRNAKIAWTEARLAAERVELAAEDVRVSQRIAVLAEVRLRAGDVSELDATSARVHALLARDGASRASRDLTMARARLGTLLGLGLLDPAVALEPPVTATDGGFELRSLLDTAVAARPDMRAAELEIEEARTRVSLNRWDVLALSFGVDANEHGSRGFEIGPAMDVGIPVFNRNQGGIARADAEVVRALRRYTSVRNRIALEVAEAHARLLTAQERAGILRTQAVPELEATVRRAARAYAAGDASELVLLETSAQLLAVRAQQLDAAAETSRARAELERSVGTRLDTGISRKEPPS